MIDKTPGSQYYTGRREGTRTRVIMVTYCANESKVTKEITPDKSRTVADHSPDFEWGYRGSGPSQLALGLLLDLTGDAEVANELAYDFKEEFIAGWKRDAWYIKVSDIEAWIAAKSQQKGEVNAGT